MLGRALAHLQPEQRPAFLGPISSACYWLAGRWLHADNPAPGDHLVPAEPAWLVVPTASETAAGIQFDNAWRYLIAEWTEPFAELAGQRDADAWLQAQLELARTWGWRAPEQIRFLLLQRLLASDDALPRSWSPLPDETPTTHFERVYQEVRFWQGDAPV